MTRNKPRLHDLLAILVATAALELGASQVHAMGFGYGIMGGFNYVPSPGDFLNSHSLLNAGRAGAPVSNNVYANNPNAFIHRIRDNGFVPHAGIVDRRSPGYQASRLRPQSLSQTSNNRPQPAASSATATAAVRRPVVPIGSFFDASRMLVWPSDAPVEGDLIDEARHLGSRLAWSSRIWSYKHRSAPITTVTDARRQTASTTVNPRCSSFEAIRRRESRRTSTCSCCRSTSHFGAANPIASSPRGHEFHTLTRCNPLTTCSQAEQPGDDRLKVPARQVDLNNAARRGRSGHWPGYPRFRKPWRSRDLLSRSPGWARGRCSRARTGGYWAGPFPASGRFPRGHRG